MAINSSIARFLFPLMFTGNFGSLMNTSNAIMSSIAPDTYVRMTGTAPGSPDVIPLEPNTGTSSGESVDDSLDPDVPYQETWSFLDYLQGLFESQGNSIAENREYNSAEAIKQRQWASRENELQRQWYTNLSNTAMTRSVADMKNAGINPILAYSNGGAAVSSTTMSPGSSASSQGVGGDTFSNILNSLANVASSVADFLPNINKIFSKSIGSNTNYNYNTLIK